MSKTVENVEKNGAELQEVTYVGLETERAHSLKVDYAVPRTNTPFLYLTVFMIQIPILISGAHTVWNSPTIPNIISNDTTINPLNQPATIMDISMITGIPHLPGLAGTLILPKLTDFLGRKKFLQVMILNILLGSILLTFSTSVTMIIISKCIISIFLSGSFAIVPIYITEICEDHNRAKFGCFIGLFHQIGHFYSFVLGPLFSYKIYNLFIGFLTVPFLLFFIFFPESPVYLISKGKKDECKNALRRLRSNKTTNEISRDIEILEANVKSKQNTKKTVTLVTVFKTKEARVGILLAMLPLAVQHLSGVAVIMTFLAPFFNSAGTSFSGHKVAVIVSIVKMSSFTFTSSVVERVGRKKMLLISSVGTGIPLFFLGCFFYLKHINSPLIHQFQWLPIILMLSNVLMYSLGLGPIPMAIMHEIFTPEIRAVAGSFVMTIVGLIVLSLTSSYPIVAATIGTHWAVWLFSFSCFVGTILIYKYLPETKGKSLIEIQEILKNY
ncbi:facilitated trehalose transporter Tret1-like [Diabrotica undecimpunctata]|uniref:facilitated trehalose transporter Tret1-like n=1 Tax=Diabrotica undecimpunctata TaxID=50387 RepID=UPI003B638FA4